MVLDGTVLGHINSASTTKHPRTEPRPEPHDSHSTNCGPGAAASVTPLSDLLFQFLKLVVEGDDTFDSAHNSSPGYVNLTPPESGPGASGTQPATVTVRSLFAWRRTCWR